MDRYSAFGAGAAAASPGRTVLEVVAAATSRGEIYDLIFSSDGTPADTAYLWKAMRGTVAGTATAFTPTEPDPDGPVPLLAANANASAEPTYTANSELLDFALNQRATFRWVAAPNGGLRLPATAAARIGFRCQHASAVLSNRCTAHWFE